MLSFFSHKDESGEGEFKISLKNCILILDT